MYLQNFDSPNTKSENSFLVPLNEAATFLACHLDLAVQDKLEMNSDKEIASCVDYEVVSAGAIDQDMLDFLQNGEKVKSCCEAKNYCFFLLENGCIYW